MGEITPAFRQASELGFFRGQCGSIFRPDIFDDGTFSEQQFKKIKAFTDVGNIESMSEERWGAAKWVKGQLRMYCVNDFNAALEPKDDVPELQKRAGLHGFVARTLHAHVGQRLVSKRSQPEQRDGSPEAHAFDHQHQNLPLHQACRRGCPSYQAHSFGAEDGLARSLYDFYRKGGLELPEDFQDKLRSEERWVNAAMSGSPVPKRVAPLFQACTEPNPTLLQRLPASPTSCKRNAPFPA